jgi:RNA recognition motif-containing protein
MNIYVGNLSREVSQDELKEAFQAYGEVDSAAVIKDKFTGESRGFGFVEMPNREQAEAALSGLNGKDLKGRNISVSEARPREGVGAGRGGGRGGYGGGGGGRGGRGGGGGGGWGGGSHW